MAACVPSWSDGFVDTYDKLEIIRCGHIGATVLYDHTSKKNVLVVGDIFAKVVSRTSGSGTSVWVDGQSYHIGEPHHVVY